MQDILNHKKDNKILNNELRIVYNRISFRRFLTCKIPI